MKNIDFSVLVMLASSMMENNMLYFLGASMILALMFTKIK